MHGPEGDIAEATQPATAGADPAASALHARLTGLLAEVSREALQGEDLEAVLRRIVECLVRNLPVAIASIILLDDDGQHFVHETWAGDLDLYPAELANGWPISVGAAGRCARTGEAQRITDVDTDPDYVPGNTRVRSEYLVPIRHRARLHGVLNIESTRADFFDQAACDVFDAIADQVAGAIHLARVVAELETANRKLQALSMIDGLTGIANRRCFDQRLASDWEWLAAESRELALVLIDADAFKPLNDAHGHLYGDECLRELARLCTRFADGGNDLVARFGGEELVLLLPGRSLEAAVALGEALRRDVEAAGMPHDASTIASCVTVSVGVSAVTPSKARSPERLLAAADRALYAAKAQGRNRVVAALTGD
ncbi:diguanylate cyclase [Lysobacter sp. A6]|uniref:diguanylate cyclase n=1 Tax=Noviluteimonas lactosilytica TaxID=2888523 RepID=A0ABS8JL12_9GAMM|nr:diguanylate cyclase [Lysobacter lactosilyticus]MCC8364296.1 diguanylate cyclase [Lysobacter lactosilyticus]